jgi:L-rhamnose-H+ transport protein
LSIIVAAGIRASLMNFGVALGGPLIHTATAAGAKSYWTVNTIWFPLLAGGAVPNIAYSIYLLRKNRTSSRFAESGTSFYWFLPAVMAFFWFGSSLLYGAASGMLGNFGAVLGWPLFMSLIVIVASVLGVITGEWKNAGPAPLRIQAGAVAFLVIAVVVLSRASV